MESLTELDFPQAKSTDKAVVYRAVGWVAGTFQPGANKFLCGVLVTQDGHKISASLDWYLYHQLKKKQKEAPQQDDWLQGVYRWKVYPRTQPLRFDLAQMKPLPSAASSSKPGQKNQRRCLDEFEVVGEILAITEEKVTAIIRRNPLTRFEYENHCQPLTLTLNGTLPLQALGQIWSLQVRRSGEKLMVADGKLYKPSPEDLAFLEKQLLNLSKNGEQVNKSKALAPDKEAAGSKASKIESAQEAATTATISKRQYEQKLLIPKALTATKSSGDRHKSSNQTTLNSGVSSHLEPSQQQKISNSCVPQKFHLSNISLAEPEHSASSSTKTPGFNQSQTQKQKGAPPKISSPGTKPESPKTRFQVKVNGQVFNGYDSVTLNKRMLCIDGKPVAQAKMAIVVGQPTTIQADSGVTRSGDQAVLISR